MENFWVQRPNWINPALSIWDSMTVNKQSSAQGTGILPPRESASSSSNDLSRQSVIAWPSSISSVHLQSIRARLAEEPCAVKLTQTYQIPKLGRINVNLDSKSTIGFSQSRGERAYQEDFSSFSSLDLPESDLDKSLRSIHRSSLVGRLSSSFGVSSQTLFAAIIDGHGGPDSAQYLSQNLPSLIESCRPSDIPNVIQTYRSLGGYFKRFRGGHLEEAGSKVFSNQHVTLSLSERLSLAFLLADQHLIHSHPKSGAVATVVLLSPLPSQNDPTRYPFFLSPLLALTIAHLGDTLALLCSAQDGKAQVLTQKHHPDSRIESERLRKIGTGLITDSFGQSRWGGTLANSRGLGDARFKKLGITGEPDASTQILKGDDYSFLVLATDGILDVITNQEIIDLCKGFKTPTEAASSVVEFAEQLGARDNMSVMVIPLLKWNETCNQKDWTLERREYRMKQLDGRNSGRQRRM
ncbi:hypothetical protein O181_085113 [Austropuccinia psidii MF-1]|uniref:PPM-type phosphatase domain-containing protein n=1 Tax=Austropuccinia psidii MF-1 TaxID=1389203 RepID=A0A9Q3FWW1_9BASI|nr:hypothetical protein [Austropuccinia psidii MF-1]